MASLTADFLLGARLALRSRLASIAVWLVATLLTTVLLAYQFSGRQPATVALDVGISVMRLTLPLLVILLVQELISREFERKLYLTTFTYPRARLYWLMGRVSAVLALTLALLSFMGVVLALLCSWLSHGYEQATPIALGLPYITTLLFLALDLLAVVAIATLLAVSAATPSFVLIGTLGFVLIARSYTPIIELLRNNPYVVDKFADPRLYQDSLGLIAVLLPDLGRLDVRMISLYDKMAFLPADWPLLSGATIAYALALLGVAAWVLNKRGFN